MSFTSSRGSPSRWRDLYVAAVARGISSCGTFAAVTALVLTLQPVGGYAVSALILASTVPVVVLAPLAGRLADQMDSRVLLVAVGSAQVLIALVLAMSTEPIMLIALRALLGCGEAIVQPTLGALTPAMVRRDDLPRASAINQTANIVGLLTGPAIAGVLVGAYGLRVPMLLTAASLVAIVAAGLIVRTRRGGATAGDTQDGAAAGAVPAGEWTLWRDPLLRVMVVSIAAVIAAIGAMNVVEVFLVRDTLGASEAAYGLLEATWTAGLLVGAWLLVRAARRARDDGALVYGLLATLGGLCIVIALAATVGAAGWLVPLWIVGGVCNGGLNVYNGVLLARRSPGHSLGRAYATIGATVHGAGMAGYAAGGLLAEVLPIRPLVAGLGLAGLAVVGLLVPPVVRTVRRERATAPCQSDAAARAARPI
jgi:MFS family permease